MKSKIIHTPDGVRDWLPEECRIKNDITLRFEGVLESYGYNKIESPTFEFAEVFDSDIINKSQNRLYKLTDNRGNSLALRADMTPPAARIAATTYKHEDGVLRLYYSGNIYTNNNNLQGKPGESPQTGAELMGSDSPQADAEIIEVAIKALKAAGISDFIINIGHTGFIQGVLEEASFPPETVEQIEEMFDKMDYAELAKIVEKTDADSKIKQILEDVPLLVGKEDIIHKYKKIVRNEKSISSLNRLLEIYQILDSAGEGERVSFDLGIVNHFDYYTGLVFIAYAKGTGYPVASGGRYDNLTEKFGKKMPAVGVTLKTTSIIEAAAESGLYHSENKRILAAYDQKSQRAARYVSSKIREAGIPVIYGLNTGDPGQSLDYCKAQAIDIMLYFAPNKITLHSIKAGTKTEVSVESLLALAEGGIIWNI